MKNKSVLVITAILILILSSAIFTISQKQKNKICFEKNCFNVELAQTNEEFEKGLMFRESLDKNSGMLFIFPAEEIHRFWMKDTLIQLDMIWMNANKEIIFIKHNAQPCLEDPCEIFVPDKKALYVLEINSGISEKIGLEIGDRAEFE